MRCRAVKALPFLIVLLLAACRQPPQPVPSPVSPIEPATNPILLPPLEELEENWNVLLPGEETACALGDPFGFFVRPADSERLLLYFQGGGACWNAITCAPGETATYDPSVTRDDNPSHSRRGIFDLANPANPFGEYSMVVIPGCTADWHLGYRTVTYESPSRSGISIYHGGYVNASAVLDWAYLNFPAPDSIFVAGSGTGAIGTPLFAALVAAHYPDAQVTQLADGAGGYHSDADEFEEILGSWGMQELLATLPELHYNASGGHAPADLYLANPALQGRVQFSQFNTVADADQVFFTRLAGASGRYLIERIDANQEAIREEIPTFVSFIAPGESSGILVSSAFYSLVVDGASVQEWVSALARGEPTEDVRCSECVAPAREP